jgi:uncharacterized membrane protein
MIMISPNKFQLDAALTAGWEGMKNNFGSVILVMGVPWLVLFAAQLATPLILQKVGMEETTASGLASVICWPLSIVYQMGVINICLKIVRGESFSFADMLTKANGFMFFVSTLLYGIGVGVGCLLLIFPGIMVALMFVFYDFLIVDKNVGPIEALKMSADLTKGIKWDLLLFFIICGAMQIVGLLFLVVGVIPAVIVSSIAKAHIYYSLVGGAGAAAAPAENWS